MTNKVNGEVVICSKMPGAYYKILTLLEKRLVDCGQICFKDEGLCVQMSRCVETKCMELHAREFLKNTVDLTQTVDSRAAFKGKVEWQDDNLNKAEIHLVKNRGKCVVSAPAVVNVVEHTHCEPPEYPIREVPDEVLIKELQRRGYVCRKQCLEHVSCAG